MTSHPMRRQDRKILDDGAVDRVIDAAVVCHVGFVDGAEPYVVPLNFGYESADGRRLARFWFHSAREGRKARLVAANARVCVQLEQDLGLIANAAHACSWSQRYRSVMAWGTARPAVDVSEASRGLDVLMRRYSNRSDWTYGEQTLRQTLVWCVDVESITAKQHGGK